MDDYRFITRSYLESLSTEEMLSLADNLRLELPPGLERIFIIEELMDLAADAVHEFGETEEKPLGVAQFQKLAPLPKQYNITFIEVLIRDPLWVYTFWEVKGHDRELYENTEDFGGYFLKVIPIPEPPVSKPGQNQPGTAASGKAGAKRTAGGGDEPFTVAVGVEDTAWYLGFPPGGGRFKVDLCVLKGNEELLLSSSAPFRLPKLLGPPDSKRSGAEDRRLILLSGIDDFRVLRNTDRLSRIKRQCGA
jgi:hypothetical protein